MPMTLPWVGWLLAVLVSFVAIEALAYWTYGQPGTLSAHIRAWGSLHPLIPFTIGCAVGALAVHFWSLSSK